MQHHRVAAHQHPATAWRIQFIPWRSRNHLWKEHFHYSVLIGIGIWAIAFSAYFIGNIDMIGLAVLSIVAVLPTLHHEIRLLRRRQVWTLIEAQCLDSEVRMFYNRYGKTVWNVRLLAEFQYMGQIWKVTPEPHARDFPSRNAANAYLEEHIGDDREMTLYVNPHNPLHCML